MSTEDEKRDTIFHYNRITYKERKCSPDIDEPSNDANLDENINPSNVVKSDIKHSPSCSCDLEEDEEIAHILHKKCPVITLAHNQIQRLLSESERLISTNNNNRYCRTAFDFLCFCKEVVSNPGNLWWISLILLVVSFLFGLLMGAASCGTNLGKFNSPILTCIDNYFIPDTYPTVQQTFRSIV